MGLVPPPSVVAMLSRGKVVAADGSVNDKGTSGMKVWICVVETIFTVAHVQSALQLLFGR